MAITHGSESLNSSQLCSEEQLFLFWFWSDMLSSRWHLFQQHTIIFQWDDAEPGLQARQTRCLFFVLYSTEHWSKKNLQIIAFHFCLCWCYVYETILKGIFLKSLNNLFLFQPALLCSFTTHSLCWWILCQGHIKHTFTSPTLQRTS